MFQSASFSCVNREHSVVSYLKNLVQKTVQQMFDKINVEQPHVARRICTLIPAQCPFETDVILFGHKLFHIPAMCKLNPAYDEFMMLRFRALSYLADDCGEDVTPYCR